MRQAGRYLPEYREIRTQAKDFLDLCYTPDRAARVTLQPIERFRPDAAILFSDILVIPDALGQQVRFVEGRGPVLEPISGPDDVTTLSTGRVLEHLAPVFETVRLTRAELPADVALIGFAGAPWTVATYMFEGGSTRDFNTVKARAIGDPETFDRLLDLLVDSTSQYLKAQVDAGAQALQLFDTWASAVPASLFGGWVTEPTRRIVEIVKAHAPDVPVIGFARGIGPRIPDYVTQTGIDAVGLDSAVTEKEALAIQAHVPVQGNLDPAFVLAGGRPMEDEARRIISELSHGPFVFNLAHGINKDTPHENVEQLAEIIRSGGKPT